LIDSSKSSIQGFMLAIIIILLSSTKNSDKYQVSFVSLKGGIVFSLRALRHLPKHDKD